MNVNPYHPPSEASTKVRLPTRAGTKPLRFFTSLLLLVLLITIIVELIHHESIVITGPLLFLAGLLLAINSLWRRDAAGLALGGSAIAFCCLIVFLINFNQWGPPQGDRPISILGYCYAAFAFPFGAVAILSRKEDEHVDDL